MLCLFKVLQPALTCSISTAQIPEKNVTKGDDDLATKTRNMKNVQGKSS